VKFGYPVSEVSRIDLGLNVEQTKLAIFDNSPLAYVNFVNQFGSEYRYGALTAGWSRDTRDSLITTRNGTLMRVTSEFASGDLDYVRLGYSQQSYFPVSRDLSILAGGEIGTAGGLGDKPLPFFKAFFAGGPGSVRGYRPFSLGPQDINGAAVGGNRKVTGNLEMLFPMPGAAQDPSLRLAWFIDGGNVFLQTIQWNDLRYSTGLAFFWASPFGPLRFSFAQPLNAQSTDHIQKLQFTFGTGF